MKPAPARLELAAAILWFHTHVNDPGPALDSLDFDSRSLLAELFVEDFAIFGGQSDWQTKLACFLKVVAPPNSTPQKRTAPPRSPRRSASARTSSPLPPDDPGRDSVSNQVDKGVPSASAAGGDSEVEGGDEDSSWGQPPPISSPSGNAARGADDGAAWGADDGAAWGADDGAAWGADDGATCDADDGATWGADGGAAGGADRDAPGASHTAGGVAGGPAGGAWGANRGAASVAAGGVAGVAGGPAGGPAGVTAGRVAVAAAPDQLRRQSRRKGRSRRSKRRGSSSSADSRQSSSDSDSGSPVTGSASLLPWVLPESLVVSAEVVAQVAAACGPHTNRLRTKVLVEGLGASDWLMRLHRGETRSAKQQRDYDKYRKRAVEDRHDPVWLHRLSIRYYAHEPTFAVDAKLLALLAAGESVCTDWSWRGLQL